MSESRTSNPGDPAFNASDDIKGPDHDGEHNAIKAPNERFGRLDWEVVLLQETSRCIRCGVEGHRSDAEDAPCKAEKPTPSSGIECLNAMRPLLNHSSKEYFQKKHNSQNLSATSSSTVDGISSGRDALCSRCNKLLSYEGLRGLSHNRSFRLCRFEELLESSSGEWPCPVCCIIRDPMGPDLSDIQSSHSCVTLEMWDFGMGLSSGFIVKVSEPGSEKHFWYKFYFLTNEGMCCVFLNPEQTFC